ncbi:uncharacterized protein LOC122372211 [Amphibalanus amphitrite]|uniref:uncharacterized protein LOC122372211 n=1 Tax=Amphibalanus amphitrite TaxID=1232801 RepID=UPI001C902FBE|nr:uncharacterized protein LOC122372211 [Amphibalanus amphitrite]
MEESELRQKRTLARVEKFVHLKLYLTGRAHAAIQGLPLTDAGYVKAIETLQERFDRPDLLRESLMQRLLNTRCVTDDNDLLQLCQMVDGLVSDVRALETMGVTAESFSVLLMPVLKSCVPETWKLQWMRAQSGVSENLPDFLQFLQREVQMKEDAAAQGTPAASPAVHQSAVRLTTHLCMMREGLLPLCAHLLPLCARLLHRLARALLSPSAAAVQPPCQATSSGQGKRLYNVNAQSSCFVQTVLVEVSGPGGVCQVRALIDGGSDSSFIRSSLAEKLGLETEEQGVFACVGFLERTEEARVYDRVSVKLTGRQGGETTLSFWKTDRLCVPVGTYSLPENLSLPPSVVLADDYREGPVDLLIGCDQIYQVVMWDQVEVGPGLRLIETVFGHVLHGQAHNQQTEQRRVYRCQLADVERMWSLDAVGISAKETADEAPPEPTR